MPGGTVSLIVPNRNNEPVLDRFLETLARNTPAPEFELIVVDDGSTDRGVAILERWRASGRFRTFELVRKQGSGIVDTLNLGLERASGEIVVRLDGDATLESPGWLERMLAFFGSDDRIGVLTGRTVFEDGRVHNYGLCLVGPEGVHDRGTTIAEPVGRRTLDLHVERPLDAECALGREVAEVDSAGGTCAMFRRELAEELGGFDTGYSPVWVEDYDFALGARRLGRKVFYLPDVHVVHRVSLRNPRHDASARELALVRLRRRFGHLVPRRLRAAAAQAAGLGHHDPRHVAQLRRHYAYWERKWGWDPLNPDMERVRERWGGTEVCWATEPALRAAGEEIIARATRSPSRPSAA
jgi:glycosyltransferase involved in cell wall biosynthesis